MSAKQIVYSPSIDQAGQGSIFFRCTFEDVDVDYESNKSKVKLTKIEVRCAGTGINANTRIEGNIYIEGNAFHAITWNDYAASGLWDSYSNVNLEGTPTTEYIVHNDDGTKSLQTWINANILCASGGYGYTGNTYQSNKTSIPLETIPRGASTISAGDGTLGEQTEVGYTALSTSYTHKLKWECGTITADNLEPDTDGKFRLTIPLTAAAQYPTMQYAPVKFTLMTYKGDYLVGSSEKTVKMQLPESIKPVISSVTFEDDTEIMYELESSSFIQNASRLKCDAEVEGQYGATITSVYATFDGRQYDFAENVFVSNEISASGTVPITITAVDSRGRTQTYSGTISVTAYNRPRITAFTAQRYDLENSRQDPAGTGIRVSWSAEVTQMDNNSGSADIEAIQKGGSYPQESFDKALTGYIDIPGIAADKSYQVRIIVKDAISRTEKTLEIATAFATIDLKAGGKGVAVGGMCDGEGLECYMNAKFYGSVFIKSGDEIISLEQYIQNIINSQ